MKKAYATDTLDMSFPGSDNFILSQVGEHERSLAQVAGAIAEGKAIDLNDLPTRLEFSGPDLPKPMPRIFARGVFLIVAPDVAEVLSRFDLGVGHVWPLECSDPGGYAYFGVYVGEEKSSWQREKSTAKRPGHKGKFRMDCLSLKRGDGSVVLGPEALEGADLWVEPSHSTVLAFFSEGLAEALMDLSLADELPFWECQIDE
ncbi:hypothetical protein AB1A64_20875 [Ruegeria sp. ANG10]|uniref:hypothetical protein n=1 Tax=Ruegeria sp. ANG10 TaxID=3042467 RepID=UPI003455E90A